MIWGCFLNYAILSERIMKFCLMYPTNFGFDPNMDLFWYNWLKAKNTYNAWNCNWIHLEWVYKMCIHEGGLDPFEKRNQVSCGQIMCWLAEMTSHDCWNTTLFHRDHRVRVLFLNQWQGLICGDKRNLPLRTTIIIIIIIYRVYIALYLSMRYHPKRLNYYPGFSPCSHWRWSISRNKFLPGNHLLHLGRERQSWIKCLGTCIHTGRNRTTDPLIVNQEHDPIRHSAPTMAVCLMFGKLWLILSTFA